MKVWVFIVIAVCLPAITAYMRTRFRGAKCSSFNETIVSYKCFLKAYSRTYVSLNSIENRKMKYEGPIEFKIKLNNRYGTIYRQVFHYEFEWCSTMNATSKNIIANLIISMLKQSAPQLFASCPLPVGIYKMTNLTIDDGTWPQAIPTGFYQIKAVFGKFYSIQIDVEIVSDIKESMG